MMWGAIGVTTLRAAASTSDPVLQSILSMASGAEFVAAYIAAKRA